VSRVAREVGTDGKLGGQAQVPSSGDLERPHRQRERHGGEPHRPGAQHRGGDHGGGQGDLSKKITVDVKGEILELKSTINTMVDQLNGFASEVSRVAREVGTDGKLGGQAQVPGVAGTVKDSRQRQLDGGEPHGPGAQHRGGDHGGGQGRLSKKITVDVKGEILELKSTINTMWMS